MKLNSTQATAFDLGYADYIALLSDDSQATRHALDRLPIEVSGWGVLCIFQMEGIFSRLTGVCACTHLCDDRLEIINCFKSFGI